MIGVGDLRWGMEGYCRLGGHAPSEEITFKQTPKYIKRIIYTNNRGQSIPGKWNSTCKGLETEETWYSRETNRWLE